MTELRNSVSVSKTNAVVGLHILQLIHESFLDKNYQTDAYWKVTDIKKIDVLQLEYSFQRRKLEMEQERNPEELKEEYLFTCYKSDEHINIIAGQGLYVQQSNFNFLGDSLLGVILCKHADIQLKAAQNEYQPKCWLMIFKVVCGRKLAVHPAGGTVIRKPTEGADCHVSSIPPVLGETLGCQAIKSQVYLYESDPTSVTGYSLRPRQCVPQAYVEFVSCSAAGTSLLPMVHLPYPGIIPHQRTLSPLSLHSTASDLIPPNQRIPQTGRDILLTWSAVGLGQKYPPYVPKSSCLHNPKRCGPVISQPPNNLPTYLSAVNFNHLNWQQRAAGASVGEGSNSTNRIESDTCGTNSGHLGWQQPATRPHISKDCSNPSRLEDNGLQVLLLNRTLVIELLQAFAKEMNAIAGVWKESGCNVETTSCLKNAILAVQELRVLFMQIAPVCQQFYRFAQDLFSGKTDNFPSHTIVQHQLKCLRKIQSTMSTAFKYFHEVAAQTMDSYQKGILMAQAVMSKQLLLLNCLTSLQGTLMAFNGFHANFSGVVSEEHAKQNTSVRDRPLNNSNGVVLLRQPDIATAAPETTSTLSPSLASLLAMSDGEIGQLPASSRQESVTSVCIRNNRACEPSRNDIPCNSNVRRISAECTMPCASDEAQSYLCLAENSSFQFGLRLPIVIAPDDGLVDEVLDMNSTQAVTDTEYQPVVMSIKLEKTTARDRRSIIETIFIDADELLPECIAKNEECNSDSSDRSSMPLNLVLDILGEKNPGDSLARVFCVSPDVMDESGPSNIQPFALSSSHIMKESQSEAAAATTFEERSSEQTLLTSGNKDFFPDAKYNSFFGSSQSEGVSSVTENVEPEFVVNIEPTTEESSDSEPVLSQNLNFHSQAENSNSEIIADAEVVPGLSDDVQNTVLTCSEKHGIQLEKSFGTGTVVVDNVAQMSASKKKKHVREIPKAFVRHKSFFIRKSPSRTRRSNGRKKGTMLKAILTIKPNSIKFRAGRTVLRKGHCKDAKESEASDAGRASGNVSCAEALQMSEIAEASMPGLQETDDGMTENSSVADFLVAKSQDSSSQDLSMNTCMPKDTCTNTARNDVAERCVGPSLSFSHDSAKTSDNTFKSSFLINSINAKNSNAGDKQLFQNMNSGVCALERDNGLAVVSPEEIFADSTHIPLSRVKSEPVVTDFDLAVEQKPRFFENQQAVDDEIIAEVVANAAECDGGNSDDSDDTGFLRIRIENVCSIAPEGFEAMNYSSYIKTESEANVEESAENASWGMTVSMCDVSVKPQSNFKLEDAHDGFRETPAIRVNDFASEVMTEDAAGTRCVISNSKASGEVVSVAQPTSLIDPSSNQSVAKEQLCQEEEIVDVGDAEYSSTVGQPLTKSGALKDRISDLVHGENFDDCDIEFDVLYENTSDENNDEDEENDRSDSSKCKDNAGDPEMSDEVLKFYSLGGDNYETADVHSTLDLMTLSVKTAPTGSTGGPESGRKQVKKRKHNGSGGRKRRRKKRIPKAATKIGKLPIENQESGLVLTPEKTNKMVSERAVEAGKKECTVEELISPSSSGPQRRKRFDRRLVKESHINAFLVSADAEKLCCALPELGLVDGAIASELKGKSVNDESTGFHDKSLCLESCGPDLLENETGNLKLAKLDETPKADVQETESEVKANEDTEEPGEKDLPIVQDEHQIENAVDQSDVEKSETTITKKRKRRYAMTGRSKRRKRTASPTKMCERARKCNHSAQKSDTNVDAVEVSEPDDDCKTDEKQPFCCDEGKKCAEIPEAVQNLFVRGTSPVTSPIRTSPRRKAAVLCKQSEPVKPKLCRKRRTSSKAVDVPPESILLDMLNDDKFLETVKSAVKSVEHSSSVVCGNSSEPALKVRCPEELQTNQLSVEESNPAYFTDITSTFQHDDENNKSSNVSAESVAAYCEDVDFLNGWKPSSEEHLEAKSPGCFSVRTSSTVYSENGKVQTSHCGGSDSTISASSYSALINAVDSAGSSISFDAIRCALKTVASSKGVTPHHAVEAMKIHDHTIETSYPDSVAQQDISKEGICSEGIQPSFGLLSEPKTAPDTSARDCSALGSGVSSAKTVIPLDVYRRNVRQSNYKIIKDTESNNEPAFYTGVVVKPAADCPTHVTNQGKYHSGQISSRDPRLARMKQQSSVVQPLMQLETSFPSSLPRTVLAHYSSVQEFQEVELQNDASFQSTTSRPAQTVGSFPGYFHSFSNTDSPIRSNPLVNKSSNPLVNKPVCSITPFIHQSEKSICNDQQGDFLPTVATSQQDVEKLPSKLTWDGNWQLIPISNLPPRPPIIFARLPLSERKRDGFLSDPRIRNERELSVRRQLSRPDSVCDDVPLVIDGDDASGNIKPRRSSGGILSNAKFLSKENSNWEDTADKAKDWFFPGKSPIRTGDVAKRSLPENLCSQTSKGKLAPAHDILNDLLSSLHTERFEEERIINMEAGMLCGLNKDRVLGKRSGLFPKLGTTSNKQQQIHCSSVDGRSSVVAKHDRDRDNGKRERDHKSGDKPGHITADVHQRDRDKRSLSRTSSHGHRTKDNLHSRRDQSSRKDFDNRESSRTEKDRHYRRSHVKPRLNVNSEDSAVCLISTNSATNAEEKRPNEECIKKCEHKTESIDGRKLLKKSPTPRSSCAHKDDRQDRVKSLHRNKEGNLRLLSETKMEKSELDLKIHDAKTRESMDDALRRKKRLAMHSSQVDDVSESCLKQYDKKEHGNSSRDGSGSRDGRKSIETVNEKSCHKDMNKSQCQSQGSNDCKESLHGQEKGRHLHGRERLEKRRLSHGDVKELTNTKDVDWRMTSYSGAKVKEPIQSPTSCSSLQQNFVSTADIRIGQNEGADMEAKNMNSHRSANCAVEQLALNADNSSRVSVAGTISQDSTVDFTQADEEHEGGSLVIHMVDGGDKMDDHSHLESMLPKQPSCIEEDVHNDLKASDANEPDKHCTISVSSCSVTDEALPGDEKKPADELAASNNPGPCKFFYEEVSCSIAPAANTQIRADILKSIRSLKLQLEDKLKSDVDVSDVSSDIKTNENNGSTCLADGSNKNSCHWSNFSSSDLVGNLIEAEEKNRLFYWTQKISSSDGLTESDCSKSSFSAMTSVKTTKSSVSSELSENTSATTHQSLSARAEAQFEKSELIDDSSQGHANCAVPFSADAAILCLPSKLSEIKVGDITELSCVKQERVDNVAEILEDRTVEGCDDDWKERNVVASVCGKVLLEVQKTADSEGEPTDVTGICDVSDLIDVEPNTTTSYGDSGEDKQCLDKVWETTEIQLEPSLPSAKFTPPGNSEQSALGINDDTQVQCTSQGTGKLLETERESRDQPFEPSHSCCGSSAVNTRKIRAADVFDDVFSSVTASDLNKVNSLDCDQPVAGSYKVMKTEPDSLAQGLQSDQNMIETDDGCKKESSSDVAGPSGSIKPSVYRLRRRSGKIADEWSDISSGWKELSRDYDEPAGEDVPGAVVGASSCTELTSDISTVALAAYKEVFKKELAMTEQKIMDTCVFTDPCDGLTEGQIKKLLRMNATNPEVEQELRLEYDILDLDRDVGKIQDCMEKIRSQLSEYRSPALDRTYDAVEHKFNFLLAKKEMYQHRLISLRRYQKSHFVHVVPSEFLLDDEIEKYISSEGMLLFLHKPTISVQNCVRLATLKKELVQTQNAMELTSAKQVVDLRRLAIKLRWLHLQRKVLLQQLCCSTEKGQQRLIQYLEEKLTWYKALQSEVESAGDEQTEDDVQSFVWETINVFESYIGTLQSAQKSPTNGRWTLDTTPIFRKRDRSRSSGESINHSQVKKRRQTLGVNFDGSHFDQSTSRQCGWQVGSNTSFHDQEDPRLSEDGGERWGGYRQLQSSSEFEGNKSRYRRSQERTDVEDEREEWLVSRYGHSGGNLEAVWREERTRRWECSKIEDRYEQSINMYTTRPYYEDSSYSRSWSDQDYMGRCPRGWLQNQ